jgi:hypothetical protein
VKPKHELPALRDEKTPDVILWHPYRISCLSRSVPRFALGFDFMGFVSKLNCRCFEAMQLLMLQFYRIWFLSLTRAVDIQHLHIMYEHPVYNCYCCPMIKTGSFYLHSKIIFYFSFLYLVTEADLSS